MNKTIQIKNYVCNLPYIRMTKNVQVGTINNVWCYIHDTPIDRMKQIKGRVVLCSVFKSKI